MFWVWSFKSRADYNGGRTIFQNGEYKNQVQVDRGTELKDAYWQKNIIKSCGGLTNGLIDNDFASCFLFKSIT